MNWISVKDKLPEIIPNNQGGASEYVLAYIPSEERTKWTGDIYFICYYTKEGWHYYYGDPFWPEDKSAISHWMPLPEPPK